MTTRGIRRFALAGLLCAVACDDPRIEEYEPRTGIITGTIIYPESPGPGPCDTDGRGNVIITLFRSDALPPPQGTSGPINFIVVPEEQLFDAEADNGVFTTTYTMPTVPEGQYQLRAFIDSDDDFHPTVPALAGYGAGDVAGGHVDTATGEFLDVTVETDKVTAQVTITIGSVVPVEAPAFTHGSTTSFGVPFATPQPMTLFSTGLSRPGIDVDPRCSRFLVSYADLDGDGTPDDANGDHLPDVFPQVLLRLEKTETQTRDILIPGIIDPLPFRDALSVVSAVPTSTLTVLLPPVAVEVVDGERRIIDTIPEGRYETIVISGTGQTWQIPNDLGADPRTLPYPLGGDAITSQATWVEMRAGPTPPAGGIRGTVQVDTEAEGDVYVAIFDANNPPPPVGTGGAVGLATVPAAAFGSSRAMRQAAFEVTGLPDGNYLLSGLLDVDGTFSPIAEILQQPSAADFVSGAPAVVSVAGGVTDGATVRIDTAVGFDRPAFRIVGPTSLSRAAFPTSIRLAAHSVPSLGIDAMTAAVPVVLTDEDELGDNFLDLRPRVLLTRLVDEGDARTAPNDGIVVPTTVDVIPYYASLLGGVPAIPAAEYDVVLPPVAVSLVTGERISPPPPGRYRVNVLSATGQTWSVPNDLDVVFGRVGGPFADPTQAQVVTIEDTPLPRGAIAGQVTLPTAPAADFSVVVFAFAADDPPPPLGGGAPRAVNVLSSADFAGGMTASYALGPLATGTYTVQAFLDADDDFTAWYDVLNQPDRGDLRGGAVDMEGRLRPIAVQAEQGVTPDVGVVISPVGAYATDRPAFTVRGPAPVLATSSVTVTFDALRATTDVLSVDAVFDVRWLDATGDGVADDLNRDGLPDVFPIVVADLLDAEDETGLTLASPGVRIPGIIDPRQFPGFPALNPTATATVVIANSMTVLFPALAVREDMPQTPVPAPAGRYRITVVNQSGQTWSLPNLLQGATGTAFTESQGIFLSVPE